MALLCFVNRPTDTLYRVSERNRGTVRGWGGDARNARAADHAIYALEEFTEAEEAFVVFEKLLSLRCVDKSDRI
jgi:hypothetical protein